MINTRYNDKNSIYFTNNNYYYAKSYTKNTIKFLFINIKTIY